VGVEKEVGFMLGKIAIFMLACSTAVTPVYVGQMNQPIVVENRVIDNENTVTVTPELIVEQPITIENEPTETIAPIEAIPAAELVSEQPISAENKAAESIKAVMVEPVAAKTVISVNRDKTLKQVIKEAFDRVYKRLNAKFEQTRLRNLATKFNEI